MQRAFLQKLYEHDVKFPFPCQVDVNTGTNSISSLSPNLGAVAKTPQGSSPIFAILREMKEKRERYFLKKTEKERKKERKKNTYILIAREVFVTLAVQARMIKSGKVSDKLDKLFALQNIAKLQGIGFTLVFGFKIYRDLTKSATFQFGFMCCICLNQGSFEKVVHKTDI